MKMSILCHEDLTYSRNDKARILKMSSNTKTMLIRMSVVDKRLSRVEPFPMKLLSIASAVVEIRMQAVTI